MMNNRLKILSLLTFFVFCTNVFAPGLRTRLHEQIEQTRGTTPTKQSNLRERLDYLITQAREMQAQQGGISKKPRSKSRSHGHSSKEGTASINKEPRFSKRLQDRIKQTRLETTPTKKSPSKSRSHRLSSSKNPSLAPSTAPKHRTKSPSRNRPSASTTNPAPTHNQTIEFKMLNCARQVHNRCAFHAIMNAWYIGDFFCNKGGIQTIFAAPEDVIEHLNAKLLSIQPNHFVENAKQINLNSPQLSPDNIRELGNAVSGGFVEAPTVFLINRLINAQAPGTLTPRWTNPQSRRHLSTTVCLTGKTLKQFTTDLQTAGEIDQFWFLVADETYFDLSLDKIANFVQGKAPICLVFNIGDHWICASMIFNPQTKKTLILVADSHHSNISTTIQEQLKSFVRALLHYAGA